LAWWLWADDTHRADRGLAETAPALPSPAPDAVETERARPEVEGLARVEGVVTGPDGPVWNARVKIHGAGERAAFDETGTDHEGRFSIEFRVKAPGEEIDVSVLPPEGMPMQPRRFDAIYVEPGLTVRRDAAFSPNPVLRGVARGHRSVRTNAATLAAVPFAEWEALRQRTPGGYPAWSAIGPLVRARERAAPGFAFAQLEDGLYALVSASRAYIVLEPPAARPGDFVTVDLAYVTDVRFHVTDAATGAVVENVEVEVVGAGGPLTRAKGNGSFPARLRWDGYAKGESRTLRVSAPGYHAAESTAAPMGHPGGFFQLVSRDAATVRFEIRGDGAPSYARDAELVGSLRVRGNPRIEFLRAPVVERKGLTVTFAAPAGDWSWTFGAHRGRRLRPIELDAGRIRIEVPVPATLELDWTGVEQYVARGGVVATGPKLAWRAGGDGVARLVEVEPLGGRLVLAQYARWDAEPPARVFVPAGVWMLHWCVLDDTKLLWRERPLHLAAGQHARVAMNSR